MFRNKMEDLLKWKANKQRLPMILLGARQVGKTYLIKEFAKTQYEEVFYINFELEPQFRELFEKDLNPSRIISDIELVFMKKIEASKALLIFDEIQLEMKAITALKYFAEIMPDIHIIGTGSLLGVAVNRERFSFPVGKVEFHYLYPFTFDEFLRGINMDMYIERIQHCYKSNEAMPEQVHESLMVLYKHYLYVGGMPAAINNYKLYDRDLVKFERMVHTNIINAYLADMSKYTSSSEVLKVQKIYLSIPNQLAGDNKKFKYALVDKGAKALTYGSSIEWLLLSQVNIECSMINRGEIPLSVYKEAKHFKIYMSDVGLLMLLTKIPYITMAKENEHNLFKGAITENYVAQQLAAKNQEIFYWKNNTYEVDFIIQRDDKIIPIEVKSGSNKRSRSLMEYRRQYNPEICIRISSKNFGFVNGIKSVPLYSVYLI